MSPSRDRASSHVGPPLLKCATVGRVPPSSGGSHRTVAASQPHARISDARSMLAVWSTRREGGAPGEARTRRLSIPYQALGPPVAIPWSLRPRPTNHCGPRSGVRSPPLKCNRGVLRC